MQTPLTGQPFGLTGLFMWLVTARMTKQKWEWAGSDQKTTEVGRAGEKPDIANMSNHKKKAECEGGEKVGHLCDDQKSVNSQCKCTQTVGQNEACSLAQWCAFPQVAEMLTQRLSLSWPGVWGFLCRVSRITKVDPSGAHTHGDTPAVTNVQSSSGWGTVKGLWVCAAVTVRQNKQEKVLMCPCCKG